MKNNNIFSYKKIIDAFCLLGIFYLPVFFVAFLFIGPVQRYFVSSGEPREQLIGIMLSGVPICPFSIIWISLRVSKKYNEFIKKQNKITFCLYQYKILYYAFNLFD